ncbi:hypothetical protein [Albidovulum sp.]
MRETVSLASIFLLLALAGLEPGQAQVNKSCHVGGLTEIFSDC